MVPSPVNRERRSASEALPLGRRLIWKLANQENRTQVELGKKCNRFTRGKEGGLQETERVRRRNSQTGREKTETKRAREGERFEGEGKKEKWGRKKELKLFWDTQ
jgi:hypothetical protein